MKLTNSLESLILANRSFPGRQKGLKCKTEVYIVIECFFQLVSWLLLCCKLNFLYLKAQFQWLKGFAFEKGIFLVAQREQFIYLHHKSQCGNQYVFFYSTLWNQSLLFFFNWKSPLAKNMQFWRIKLFVWSRIKTGVLKASKM